VVASITREYEVAKATEKTMQLSLDKSKAEIQDMSRKEFQLASLERDVQTNRGSTTCSSPRQGDGRYRRSAVHVARVVDPAIVTGGPVKPQKSRIISISLVIGLMLG